MLVQGKRFFTNGLSSGSVGNLNIWPEKNLCIASLKIALTRGMRRDAHWNFSCQATFLCTCVFPLTLLQLWEKHKATRVFIPSTQKSSSNSQATSNLTQAVDRFLVFTWRHQILKFKTGRPKKCLPSFKETLPKNMSVHNFLARCCASFWK